MKTVTAWIALGANLGDPVAMLGEAFDALADLPDTRLAARSSLYRTAPIDAPGQPDYYNAVASLETALSADTLLDALQDIETRCGRVRAYRNAPRTLDLDLLLYGDEQRESERLTLPHPRMHLRAFVLAPLVELAPALTIPGRGAIGPLLAACADQNIEKLPRS
ncbi:2-amino-4-hydroxy-6-hydroxymethyldihydropteridine diphosphokinase [Niveibacterium sp. SC-1]|uniref:2-amino-4-hydroxy-6- hydroxymethyldihydropteridine diphosphokinase n=1 Tax=Niveibacterium sp. SC-1 TaxID=3135646 RepID=UPI00311DA8E1